MTRIKSHNIAPEVLAVLTRSTITANSLTLPDQLERKLYEATNKIIVAAGGKWDRHAKCHTFRMDPRSALGMAIETGAIVDEKATYQAFYTPLDVARRMADELAGSLDVHGALNGFRVLEPSAGDGRLASIIRGRGGMVLCVEIRKDAAAELRKTYPTIEGDFLKMKPGAALFDGVLMNPPFTGDQDAAHILHAWSFLRPGGVMVAICSPRYTFTSNKRCTALYDLIRDAKRANVRELPAGTFSESGTGVRTMLLTLEKHE